MDILVESADTINFILLATDILVESLDEPHAIDNHGFLIESLSVMNLMLLATMDILVESVNEPHAIGHHRYPCRKCRCNKPHTSGNHGYPCRKCR